MAVIAALSKGYDLDYIWRQVGRDPAKDAVGYYIQASESGGEPPGPWWARMPGPYASSTAAPALGRTSARNPSRVRRLQHTTRKPHGEMTQWIRDLAAAHRTFASQLGGGG